MDKALINDPDRYRWTAEMLINFAAAGQKMVISLTENAVGSSDAESLIYGPQDFTKIIDEFNLGLNNIFILGAPKLVRAAIAIDKELARLAKLATSKLWIPEEWRSERIHLNAQVRIFYIAARETLGIDSADFDGDLWISTVAVHDQDFIVKE